MRDVAVKLRRSATGKNFPNRVDDYAWLDASSKIATLRRVAKALGLTLRIELGD